MPPLVVGVFACGTFMTLSQRAAQKGGEAQAAIGALELLSLRGHAPLYKGADKIKQRLLQKNGVPPYWAIPREGRGEPSRRPRQPRFGVNWTVWDEGSSKLLLTVETATIYILPPVQTIIAGCVLNSGAAKWQCGASLMRGSRLVRVGCKARPDRDNPFTPAVDPNTYLGGERAGTSALAHTAASD